MEVKILGIDIAKRVFQLHGINCFGKVVLKKRISREQLSNFIANIPPCLIGMEACGGSNYWARKFTSYGHEVRLMNPHYVKPYIKTNKNDAADAEAICEAVSRPTMRFVSIKSVEQQDIQALHRYRQRLIQGRTALVNQIRGLLTEYGIVIPQGITSLRLRLPQILDDQGNELTYLSREIINTLYQEFSIADQRIKDLDKRIMLLCKESTNCQRLMKIEGIGPLSASALLSAIGDIHAFKNGRHLAAWLGLVPRQHSSGGKQTLLGISKRGDRYLRTLLIHGARAFISFAKRKSVWLEALIKRCGKQKAYVALANKNARVVWALLTKQVDYQSTH
ncbi:MAG: IS110 family transposase [Caedibacter sp. 38-128]|nr:IS110 family transposase [Holosporales bacterium]OJX05522.1 MAG: IS110 family transposase [Caedibacter sp. 38-128]